MVLHHFTGHSNFWNTILPNVYSHKNEYFQPPIPRCGSFVECGLYNATLHWINVTNILRVTQTFFQSPVTSVQAQEKRTRSRLRVAMHPHRLTSHIRQGRVTPYTLHIQLPILLHSPPILQPATCPQHREVSRRGSAIPSEVFVVKPPRYNSHNGFLFQS